MWSEEQLSDAMKLLLDAESVEKVVTDESSYVVAQGVSYTDDLYLKALEQLEAQGRLKTVERTAERSLYTRAVRGNGGIEPSNTDLV